MKCEAEDLGKASITVEEDDYSSLKPYFENTIVTDSELGLCCISIRPVPAGVPITDTRFWKVICRLETTVMLKYRKLINEVKDLRQIVESLIVTSSGVGLSNNLGNSTTIGMTQRAITDNIAKLRKEISDIKGTNEFGFILDIFPDFIIKKSQTPISVFCNAGNDVFDSIRVYFDDELQFEREEINKYKYDSVINKSTNIRVETVIDGIYSVQTKKINYYYPFFIGCGKTLDSIIDERNVIDYDGNVQGVYDITCKDEDYIFIVIGKEADAQIEQIELNDFNIPLTKTEYEDYFVYQSTNTYDAGFYKIDINY